MRLGVWSQDGEAVEVVGACEACLEAASQAAATSVGASEETQKLFEGSSRPLRRRGGRKSHTDCLSPRLCGQRPVSLLPFGHRIALQPRPKPNLDPNWFRRLSKTFNSF